MNKKTLYLSVIFALLMIICFSNKSYAGVQEWNALDFDVELNDDGSMYVTETWDVYVSNTNTLFKDYELDSSKFSGITNVIVSQVDNGTTVPLTQIYEEQYHVDSGCYYAMPLEDNPSQFEIAWNVGLDDSWDNRTYKISYKVLDAVKIYNDCTEVYWQFLGVNNEMPGKNVTGTITLPRSVSDIEKLRVWGHGDLSAEIQKISTDTVKFSMPKIPAKSMLEVRVVTDENIYKECNNVYNYNKLDSIISEETEWAEEANAQRKKAKTLWYGFLTVYCGILLFFLLKILKYINQGKELKEQYSYGNQDLKYFRDIPMRDATPVKATYFYYFDGNKSLPAIKDCFSATILSFALKKIVEFEPIDKKNVRIKFLKNNEEEIELDKDERIVYKLLKKAAMDRDSITTEELNRFAKKHYELFHSEMEKFGDYGDEYVRREGYIDSERKEIARKLSSKATPYLIAILAIIFVVVPITGSIFILKWLIPLFVEWGICIKICYSNVKKVNILTQGGDELSRRWKGLKNYMEEFSLLKDKEVPDLILWEQYLVYATAFGISKKVIEQLKVVYPQLSDPNYYDSRYTYMYYMANPNFGGTNFVNNMGNSFNSIYNSASSAYSAAHSSSSSGSGGGGGFSGGGGGRRWRRKRRRKINYKIKDTCISVLLY